MLKQILQSLKQFFVPKVALHLDPTDIVSNPTSLLGLGAGAAGLAMGGIPGAMMGAAGLSLFGQGLSSQAQIDAAERAAQASQFRPIATGTGAATAGLRTPEMMVQDQVALISALREGAITQEDFEIGMQQAAQTGLTAQLSPELQATRNRLLGMGQEGLEAFQTFDPTEAGALFTQQLDAMSAPQEQRQRLSLENRLFQQGLTGQRGQHTGAGQARTEALMTAQAMAQNQRNLTGLQMGQQQQERLFQQAIGGIQGATALDALAQQQLSQSLVAGGAATTAATNAANFQFQAGQNQADAMAGFFSGLGGGLTQLAFQPTPQTQQPLFAGGGASPSTMYTGDNRMLVNLP